MVQKNAIFRSSHSVKLAMRKRVTGPFPSFFIDLLNVLVYRQNRRSDDWGASKVRSCIENVHVSRSLTAVVLLGACASAVVVVRCCYLATVAVVAAADGTVADAGIDIVGSPQQTNLLPLLLNNAILLVKKSTNKLILPCLRFPRCLLLTLMSFFLLPPHLSLHLSSLRLHFDEHFPLHLLCCFDGCDLLPLGKKNLLLLDLSLQQQVGFSLCEQLIENNVKLRPLLLGSLTASEVFGELRLFIASSSFNTTLNSAQDSMLLFE